MANIKKKYYNYKDVKRQNFTYRDVSDRINDYHTIYKDYVDDFIIDQASRCMDCGIPFCHGFGCPLSNRIPDFNDYVYRGLWKDASEVLHSTNNFPEITGAICPALCEEACTLNVGIEPVTIKNIELAIVEKGFKSGWIHAVKPKVRTGKKVAVIGSGPAGLVAAQDLNKFGHTVVVYEKADKAGGFLRYGVPDFKLEKHLIDRRIKLLEEEGIEFKYNIDAGEDISAEELKKKFDAVLITTGCRVPRDLPVEGRELKGIHFATDYLTQSNKRVAGETIPADHLIDAKNKDVVVIGGGDTGSDCIGTARRQGANNIYQLEIMPKPPLGRADSTPWPMYAKKLRTSSSHEEGCERHWSVLTQKILGAGRVEKILTREVEWYTENGKMNMREKTNTDQEIKADLVLLAMGFVHTEKSRLIDELSIELDERGNIKTGTQGYGATNIEGVFAAGDAVRGPSLVVWAFQYAKEAAIEIHDYLN